MFHVPDSSMGCRYHDCRAKIQVRRIKNRKKGTDKHAVISTTMIAIREKSKYHLYKAA